MFAITVPACAGHFRIVPVSVFRVEIKNTVFMTYPMHNWASYWLFTMVYACVPHFNLWQGHKHPWSFQLRIALNLKSTGHYMGIDLVPYVKSHTSAQHNNPGYFSLAATALKPQQIPMFLHISARVWGRRWSPHTSEQKGSMLKQQ